MEIKRTTKIFVETNRRFVINQPEPIAKIICSECSELMLTAEAFADLFGVSRRCVYRTVETTDSTHFTESESGILFVCPNSLAAILTNQQ